MLFTSDAVRGCCRSAQALARPCHHGRSQRVIAVLFDRQRHMQQFVLGRPGGRDRIGELRLAFGQRAGLVEGDADVSVPRFSSAPPPLINTPPRAARATPLSTALGTEMASAQGLAATSTAIAR
jgi:hypothetical protein